MEEVLCDLVTVVGHWEDSLQPAVLMCILCSQLED